MNINTRKKRIRVTQRDIAKARESILAQPASPMPKRATPQEQEPKWDKDHWYGMIYCDSYGIAWLADTKALDGNYCLGKTEEVLGVMKQGKVNKEDPIDIIKAMKRYRSEKKSQSCHSASGNRLGGTTIPLQKSTRATFREDPEFLKILNALIKYGYGLPTIQNKVRSKGYNIPYRTLGRWVKAIKDKE